MCKENGLVKKSAKPFVGEIDLWPFNWSPAGLAVCDGSLLQINQYPDLFSLIGITYGGDGITTFGLPDMRGRIPVGMGQQVGGTDYALGDDGGTEEVTLTAAQGSLPAHVHTVSGTVKSKCDSEVGGSNSPADKVMANSGAINLYSALAPNGVMAAAEVLLGADANAAAPAAEAHENRQPFLVLNYIIALNGIIPNREV